MVLNGVFGECALINSPCALGVFEKKGGPADSGPPWHYCFSSISCFCTALVAKLALISGKPLMF